MVDGLVYDYYGRYIFKLIGFGIFVLKAGNLSALSYIEIQRDESFVLCFDTVSWVEFFDRI